MPLRLITGPANSTKAGVVLDAYRDALRDAPVLVVPTRADVDHYRAELAEDGLVLGVRVERFSGLIAEIAGRLGTTADPLSAVARAQLVSGAIARVRLRTLGSSASTPGFAHTLAELISELREHRVGPARLAAALRAWAGPDPERAAYGEDLAALYRTYAELLEAVGRPDVELHTSRALDALRLEPGRWRATPVLFYGFDDFTPLELDAVETLSRAGAPVTVSLPYEPGRVALEGRAGTFQALRPLADEHRQLPSSPDFYADGSAGALHHLERSLFEPGAGRARAGGAITLLEGGGERAEFELVAGEVARLIEQGMAPGAIAVVVRSESTRAGLLDDVLTRHGIPHALVRSQALRDTAVGAGLLALDRCAAGRGGAQDLLRWLRTPGVLRVPELADRLERRLRRDGIHDGSAARVLWERDGWPLEELDRLAQAQSAGRRAHAEELRGALDRLFAAPHRRQAAVLSDAQLPEAQAWSAARAALTDLADLEAVSPGLGGPPEDLVARLGELQLTVGGRPSQDCVLVADPLALRARRVRALFACGLLEGHIPRGSVPEPFLSAERRRELALASGLVLDRADDALSAERYLFYSTVSRAEERLALSWRTGDDDGQPTLRSLFVDDVCDCFEEDLLGARRQRRLGTVDPADVASVAPNSALGEGEHRLTHPLVLADLRERPAYSASALELYLACPVRWFVERYLAPGLLEPDPEALARGALAHGVLERTLHELERHTGSARPRPEVLALARQLAREAIEQDPEGVRALSPSPERRAPALRRLQADLDRYLELSARSGPHFEPRHLELEFGMHPNVVPAGDEQPTPALELEPGLMLRGRIDRVDVDPGGTQALVYDYKGREATPARAWEEKGRLQIPLYMRAVRDLLGLEPVGGFYQPLSARDQRPRGALLTEADPDLDCSANDRFGAEELDALIASATRRASEAAQRIRAGRLEPRPQTCSPSGVCAYPQICRCESSEAVAPESGQPVPGDQAPSFEDEA